MMHIGSINLDTNTFFADKHPFIKPTETLTAFLSPDVGITGFDARI
jgi:hypothetical protein